MSLRAWMKRRIQELPTGEYVCKVTTLDSISAYDVLEPIVRCEDCKNFRERDQTCGSWQWHRWDEAPEVDLDGFCAWGERKAVE